MTTPLTTQAQELERHAGMVRALVRALVHDVPDADDLEQQVWLAALRRPPRPGSRWPAWVSAVVRRWRSKFRRETERRLRRELTAARVEAQPGAGEVAARLEAAQRLLAALQALEEPFRVAVTLRYLEGLPPRVIARRLTIPVATVRSRVRRGLLELRALLGGARGADAGGWLMAVVPLLGTARWDAIGGSILMGTKAKLSAALLACAVFVGWWAWPLRTDGPMTEAPGGTAAAEVAPARRADAQHGIAASQPATRVAVASEAGWTVRGQTVDITSGPVPRVLVHAELFAGYEAVGTPRVAVDLHSDERGGLEWQLLPPTGAVLLRLQAEAPGHSGRAVEVVVPAGEGAPQDVELTLLRLPGRLVGTVVDAAGLPVPDATVQLRGLMYECLTRTDRDGRYVLPVPAISPLAAVASAAGHGRRTGQAAVAAGRDARLDFRLPAGTVLRGVVRDEQGQPIAGASVVSPWALESPAVSDAAGAYVLSGLDPEDRESHSVWVRARGFLGQQVNVSLRPGTTERDVTLVRGARLCGVVVGDGGAPLVGARLQVALRGVGGGSIVGPWTALSRDGGRFCLEGVPEGRHQVVVERTGYAPREVAARFEARGTEELSIQLERGGRLRGVVVDGAGLGVAGARARLRTVSGGFLTQGARADAAGRFELGGVPREGADVSVWHPGYIGAHERVAADGSERRFVLARAGGVAGQVVDAATGQPIPRFEIRFVQAQVGPGEQPASYGARWGNGCTFEDPEGRWQTQVEHEQLAVGSVLGVEASAEGYAPKADLHVVVRGPGDLQPTVLRLHGGSEVRGRVLLADSEAPLAGARVSVVPDPARGEPRELAVRTDAAGEFALRGLAAGDVTLRVEHPDWPTAEDGPFLVPGAGRAVARTIRVASGSTLIGRVLDPRGAPVPNAELELTFWRDEHAEGPKWTARADGEGRFRIEHLRPGSYTAAHVARRGDVEATLFVVRVLVPDGVLPFDLDPNRGVGVLRVRITRGGAPVELMAASVSAWPFAADRALLAAPHRCTWGGFVENGVCELRGLAPGSYLCMLGGMRRIEVGADAPAELVVELTR